MPEVRKIFIDFSNEEKELFVDLFSITSISSRKEGQTYIFVNGDVEGFLVKLTVEEDFNKIHEAHRKVEQWNN